MSFSQILHVSNVAATGATSDDRGMSASGSSVQAPTMRHSPPPGLHIIKKDKEIYKHLANRDPSLPPVIWRPAHPNIESPLAKHVNNVYVLSMDLSKEAMEERKSATMGLHAPLGPDASLQDSGLLRLHFGDVVFGRQLGSQTCENDVLLQYVTDPSALYAQDAEDLTRIAQLILGTEEYRLSHGGSCPFADDPANVCAREGRKCFTIGVSRQAPRNCTAPCKSDCVCKTPAETRVGRKRILTDAVRIASRAFAVHDPQAYKILKNYSEVVNSPRVGVLENCLYQSAQVNIANAEIHDSRASLKDQMGKSGDNHIDPHDAHALLSTMLCHPYLPLRLRGWPISRPVARHHSGTPPLAPSGCTEVSLSAVRLNIILYSHQHMLEHTAFSTLAAFSGAPTRANPPADGEEELEEDPARVSGGSAGGADAGDPVIRTSAAFTNPKFEHLTAPPAPLSSQAIYSRDGSSIMTDQCHLDYIARSMIQLTVGVLRQMGYPVSVNATQMLSAIKLTPPGGDVLTPRAWPLGPDGTVFRLHPLESDEALLHLRPDAPLTRESAIYRYMWLCAQRGQMIPQTAPKYDEHGNRLSALKRNEPTGAKSGSTKAPARAPRKPPVAPGAKTSTRARASLAEAQTPAAASDVQGPSAAASHFLQTTGVCAAIVRRQRSKLVETAGVTKKRAKRVGVSDRTRQQPRSSADPPARILRNRVAPVVDRKPFSNVNVVVEGARSPSRSEAGTFSEDESPMDEDRTEEDPTEYDVRSITDHRLHANGRELEYHILWDNGEQTWQPLKDLIGCDDALTEYNIQHRIISSSAGTSHLPDGSTDVQRAIIVHGVADVSDSDAMDVDEPGGDGHSADDGHSSELEQVDMPSDRTVLASLLRSQGQALFDQPIKVLSLAIEAAKQAGRATDMASLNALAQPLAPAVRAFVNGEPMRAVDLSTAYMVKTALPAARSLCHMTSVSDVLEGDALLMRHCAMTALLGLEHFIDQLSTNLFMAYSSDSDCILWIRKLYGWAASSVDSLRAGEGDQHARVAFNPADWDPAFESVPFKIKVERVLQLYVCTKL
ncbi:hypothetical protein BD626DRAFT_579196 [Schizophyllum amplum]|uniref:Chromo domain-containing protein n=1 Tax=Schizophyllum amplum TaxID=97359 RepID=A0A550BRL6_9AGAR|nr:hypothetical protein BD626DRAFT_579196 [Auriculariopsis ampla]